MTFEVVLNIILNGFLTGLVYGLMALGLSVIFGVVRIVNFAHGELMAVAMYAAVVSFAVFGIDPLWMILPVGYYLPTVFVRLRRRYVAGEPLQRRRWAMPVV